MPTTDAQRNARDKWLKEKVEEIKFRVPKGNKVRIQEHANKFCESTNAFIYRAINETIERDLGKLEKECHSEPGTEN